MYRMVYPIHAHLWNFMKNMIRESWKWIENWTNKLQKWKYFMIFIWAIIFYCYFPQNIFSLSESFQIFLKLQNVGPHFNIAKRQFIEINISISIGEVLLLGWLPSPDECQISATLAEKLPSGAKCNFFLHRTNKIWSLIILSNCTELCDRNILNTLNKSQIQVNYWN